MKTIYLAIGIVMLIILNACNTYLSEQDNMVKKLKITELAEKEGVEQKESQRFTIRLFTTMLDPSEIEVNKGDVVELEIADLRDSIIEGNQSIIELDRFIISEFGVDEMVKKGGIITIQFTANKKGIFEYGDQTRNTLKGRLIVK